MVPNKVLEEKATEALKLKKYREEKESYTAYECISGSGEKPPYWILAKEKVARSHYIFGDHSDVQIKHTESGWTSADIIVDDINWLSARCNGEPLLLVLDLCRAHGTAKLRQRA
jgi:hypothetical protein